MTASDHEAQLPAQLRSAVFEALDRALHGVERPVPLHVPTFAGHEWKYVKDCLDTGWVSSAGAYVGQFEQAIQRYTGARHAVAVVNGTSALHVALQLAGVERDDEVLMPALTFVATANAASYAGAVPHFADVSQQTLGLCPQWLSDHLDATAERQGGRTVNRQTGRPIGAIVCMHAFGIPCDVAGLAEVAQRWGLPLVEDAAESLGSFIGARHTGTLGRLGVLSFNGNKIISTGGGGAILTDDDALAEQARHVTTTGKLPHRWAYVHDRVAYNYRLPNLNAALGLAQMEQLPGLLQRKRQIASRYIEAFENVANASILAEPEGTRSNYWLNALVLDEEPAGGLGSLLDEMHERGLLVRPIWTPMHELPMYRQCPRGELTVTQSLAGRVINLPSSAHLWDQMK